MENKRQEIFFTLDMHHALAPLLQVAACDKLYILTDTHTRTACLSHIAAQVPQAVVITIAAGDENKNLTSLAQIWDTLSRSGATRHSMMLNLGGGLVTDMGGFAAATFKRGFHFINIPTTLLAAVDAAVGGKTGINFNGLKNEIGAFALADAVVVYPPFFETLSIENQLAGYAEMLKHGLIGGTKIYNKLIETAPHLLTPAQLLPLLQESVAVKERIVEQDPTEQGVRKALNLGHTTAHAFESMAMAQNAPISHGYAVAWGLLCELILSQQLMGFPTDEVNRYAAYLKKYYGIFKIESSQYERLYDYMTHDKKNEGAEVNFTLLRSVGNFEINQLVEKEAIFTALTHYSLWCENKDLVF